MIFPMLLRESLHELRHASMLAGICLFVSIGIFSYTYLDLVNSGEFDPVHASMRYTTDFVGFCSALGIAFMCFLCQFNILQVDSELKKPEQIYAIIHLTILGVAIPVNVFIGACGYFLFGSTVEGNVFDSMHSTVGNVRTARTKTMVNVATHTIEKIMTYMTMPSKERCLIPCIPPWKTYELPEQKQW
eukprot:GEMP01055741.1.p1 GENE.GEMP01055741.1~~GEMP01055741.1.p1  ORF type:complete len:188 (+),score=25.72 GEMP01055741.1:870-1433(+)